jgi:hypothetical protein
MNEIVESRPQDPMVTVNLRFLFADDPMMPGFLMFSACFSRRKWNDFSWQRQAHDGSHSDVLYGGFLK